MSHGFASAASLIHSWKLRDILRSEGVKACFRVRGKLSQTSSRYKPTRTYTYTRYVNLLGFYIFIGGLLSQQGAASSISAQIL